MQRGVIQHTAAAEALVPWAQSWFLSLVMLVVVTVATLFIIGLVTVLNLNRKY
jgi:hypothetical protein